VKLCRKNSNKDMLSARDWYSKEGRLIEDPIARLETLHQHLEFWKDPKLEDGLGGLDSELVEQLMTIRFVRSDATVLELGGNIGRNSLIIASILTDDRRLVTVEPEPTIASNLVKNRDINGHRFHIVQKAISQKALYQGGIYNWMTITNDNPRFDQGRWTPVSTISWGELRDQFSDLHFDTLVIDCEGAWYDILRDNSDFLDNIYTIILENDFRFESQRKWVHDLLREMGFEVAASESLDPRQSKKCPFSSEAQKEFWQVWTRHK